MDIGNKVASLQVAGAKRIGHGVLTASATLAQGAKGILSVLLYY